jgi:hypothetical protein
MDVKFKKENGKIKSYKYHDVNTGGNMINNYYNTTIFELKGIYYCSYCGEETQKIDD